jgi:hypothetical protein
VTVEPSAEMSLSMPERRRSRRVTVGPTSWLAVPSTWPVQLVDLSMGGLAFSSPYGLDVGRTAAVRATLAHEAFNGHIRVCWSRPRGGGSSRSPFEIGAEFMTLEDSSAKALAIFLKLSTPERA